MTSDIKNSMNMDEIFQILAQKEETEWESMFPDGVPDITMANYIKGAVRNEQSMDEILDELSEDAKPIKGLSNRKPELPEDDDPDWVFDPTTKTADTYLEHRGQEEKPGDAPIGEVLLAARNKIGLSRSALSEKTGIGANSIVRYEKAGTGEEEGQHPPSEKLAILCWHLKIDPLIALIACLPRRYRQEAHWVFKQRKDPLFEFMESQYQTLLHENHLYRTLFARLFGKKPAQNHPEYRELLWLIGAAKEMFKKQTEFDNKMSSSRQFVPIMRKYETPLAPECIIDDWVYKGTPQINMVDGERVAEILGWESSKQEKLDISHFLDQGHIKLTANYVNSINSIRDKKSPEEDLPSPPSSNSTTPQTINKESDDERPSD